MSPASGACCRSGRCSPPRSAYALYARAAWPWIALGFVGLVPFLAVLEGARSLRRAAVLGVAMAVAFELAVFGWFAGAIATYAEIAGFVAAAGIPLVFGSYDLEDGRECNAAFFLGPDGTWSAYRKAWLFPLTERVPAWLDRPWVRARVPWLGTWKPGAGPRVVPVRLADGRLVRVAPLICYDVLAPVHALAEVRAGADLIVTLSNDSWLLDGAGPYLHLLGAAFLSIETRRPQLRATPTGVSAVFDATGEALAALVAARGRHGRPRAA